MTAPGTERRGLLNEIGAAITNVAVPHHEPPAVVLCRRIVVVIVLVIGAALLGFSLSRTPGESSFYWPNRPRPTFSRTKRRSRSIVIPSTVRRSVQQLTQHRVPGHATTELPRKVTSE
jgi:hypothetical protein